MNFGGTRSFWGHDKHGFCMKQFSSTADQHQMTLKKNEGFQWGEAELRSPLFNVKANTSFCLSLDWLMQTQMEAYFRVTLES